MMFEAFTKRQGADEIRGRTQSMITGFWANTNLDMEENDRLGMIRDVEKAAEEAIEMIYGDGPMEEEEIPWEDPLFASLKETVYSEEYDAAVAGIVKAGGVPPTPGRFEARVITEE